MNIYGKRQQAASRFFSFRIFQNPDLITTTMKLNYIPSLLFLLALVLSGFSTSAQVAINDNGDAPNPNALLDLKSSSNDKGILIPRLTAVQRTSMSLGTSDEGLTVYDTDTRTYWLWDGTRWESFVTGPKRKVGEVYDGGFVFWVDASGEHGLMASLDDLDGGSGVPFSNVNSTLIGSGAQSMTDGTTNTTAITDQAGHSTSAASLCSNYNGGGHTDWYLPSIRELNMLFSVDAVMDDILDNDGDPTTNGLRQESNSPFAGRYWSSTESSSSYAYCFLSYLNYNQQFTKLSVAGVRAVRKF
jgi:hypothetical protein